jgi:DNA-binding MarR family transcriptional regulator
MRRNRGLGVALLQRPRPHWWQTKFKEDILLIHSIFSEAAKVIMKEGVCNCLSLRQASRYITSVYDQMLSGADLRVTQFSILYKLSARGSMSINELSAILVMDRTTLGRNLKPLERDDFVVVRPGEVDRRERIVELTAMGKKKTAEALPFWREAQKVFESKFGIKRARELRETLGDVVTTSLLEEEV